MQRPSCFADFCSARGDHYAPLRCGLDHWHTDMRKFKRIVTDVCPNSRHRCIYLSEHSCADVKAKTGRFVNGERNSDIYALALVETSDSLEGTDGRVHSLNRFSRL